MKNWSTPADTQPGTRASSFPDRKAKFVVISWAGARIQKPIADGVALKLTNEAAIRDAAEKISTAGKKIASIFEGADLAAVDSLIPPSSQYKGRVFSP